jgi:hypothetical protein
MRNPEDDDYYYSQFKKAQTELVHPVNYTEIGKRYKFSIIVPYRDNKYQNRKQQLGRFVPDMTDYLTRLGANYDFCIIVVEQSQDGRKFNRGQLLNVGFRIAQEQGCDYHILHDVDLLPDDDLLGYYGFYPSSPLHIAAVWEKYHYLDLYFGGVCTFTTEHFARLNGYPNNFWGWGGEDEELYHRIVEQKMSILKPMKGSFTELPHIHTQKFPDLVNEERFELIEQRVAEGKANGLSSLRIERLHDPERLNSHALKYLVVL